MIFDYKILRENKLFLCVIYWIATNLSYLLTFLDWLHVALHSKTKPKTWLKVYWQTTHLLSFLEIRLFSILFVNSSERELLKISDNTNRDLSLLYKVAYFRVFEWYTGCWSKLILKHYVIIWLYVIKWYYVIIITVISSRDVCCISFSR